MRTGFRRLGLVVVAALSVGVVAQEGPAPPAGYDAYGLTWNQRVRYHTAVERVYYSHRTGTKPAFEQAVPADVIARKTRKILDQCAIIAQWHADGRGYELTDDMLDRELRRICSSTNAPDTLRELFAALDNNAYLVKEILVRPILADKMTRVLYQNDAEFHRPQRELAEHIHAEVLANRGENMEATARALGGKYSFFTLRASPEPEVSELDEDGEGAMAHRVSNPATGWVEIKGTDLIRRHEELKASHDAPRLRATHEEWVIERLRGTGSAAGGSAPGAEAVSAVEVESIAVRKEPFESWLHAAVGGLTSSAAPVGTRIESPGGGERHTSQTSNAETPRPMDSRRIPFELLLSPGPDLTMACAPDSWLATLEGAPPPRGYQKSVWTGTEMIVWGGIDEYFRSRDDGGRYNPATDTWTRTTTVGAPTARYGHTAVWTGALMIVWGGIDGGQTNTGARYNPATDSWTATTLSGAPAGRWGHTAVWTGTKMIVWGGDLAGTGYTNTGGQYTPGTNTWSSTSITGVPTGRASHAAVWTGTVMVVWGGYNGAYLNTGGRYSPATNSWLSTTAADAPLARYDPTAIWTGDEVIFWGGRGDDGGYLNTGGRYSPALDQWAATTTDGGPGVRYLHTAVWTGSEMIVWGGGGTFDNDGGRYDPIADTWIPTSQVGAPGGRYVHTAVWTGTEMIVWGGESGSFAELNDGGRYNPVSDTWTPTSTEAAPYGRTSHSAVWTGKELIVWGGQPGVDSLDSGGRYEPATNNWTPTSVVGAPTKRFGHTGTWTGSEMIIWGGYDNAYYVNDGGRYWPDADLWSPTNLIDAPVGRLFPTAVWTGRELLVWGGYHMDWNGCGCAVYENTGGRYDPALDSWVAINTAGAPSGRTDHTAVWSGTQMIVWGGYNATTPSYKTDGGRYSLATDSWMPTSTTGAPSGRSLHTAVWTGTQMIVWGGYSPTTPTYKNTGGRYDPVSNLWTATSVTGAPTGRSVHAATWTGTQMIVWGGYSPTAPAYKNTGSRYAPASNTWTAITTTGSPAGRTGPTAVWTGTTMIVWGGADAIHWLDSGGVYTPSCPFGAGNPSAVPDGGAVTGAPLTVARNGDGSLGLSWGAACSGTDYGVFAGDLATLASGYNHAPLACTTSGATAATVDPSGDAVYLLVVPHNASVEGSYGLTSADAEIPQGAASCYPQSIGTCP